jgi:hypothetical protein
MYEDDATQRFSARLYREPLQQNKIAVMRKYHKKEALPQKQTGFVCYQQAMESLSKVSGSTADTKKHE